MSEDNPPHQKMTRARVKSMFGIKFRRSEQNANTRVMGYWQPDADGSDRRVLVPEFVENTGTTQIWGQILGVYDFNSSTPLWTVTWEDGDLGDYDETTTEGLREAAQNVPLTDQVPADQGRIHTLWAYANFLVRIIMQYI
jgi:hypothetical protein